MTALEAEENAPSSGERILVKAAVAGEASAFRKLVEPHLAMLHRIATLYERNGNRRHARRVFLEIFSLDPAFREVNQRIEALSDDVRELGSNAADERVLELLDVGAPLGTIFDNLQGSNLALDPQLLAEGKKSSPELRAQ